jgi:hypothetical protein
MKIIYGLLLFTIYANSTSLGIDDLIDKAIAYHPDIKSTLEERINDGERTSNEFINRFYKKQS